MFEVTGEHIARLGDADLRTIVARLALAELRRQGCPLSAVTAGGDQDAADGGLDVRIKCFKKITNPDFVPRANTGFQVKKPDMPARAIKGEMRPRPRDRNLQNGQLRPAISELARQSGAYVIVSSQGSVADKPLAERRQAMRDALHDLPEAENLHTDFYDRDRLATWVNEYPGIAVWVRARVGLELSGWSSIGEWTGTQVAEVTAYLANDKACLTDERSRDRERLTIGEGIKRLRAALRTPKQCLRLIGLSGLGKTRLVHALFESAVGDEPLDPSLAIYTDYSGEPDPTAREMARRLVISGQRAILIIDNCNPATHTELAHICSDGASNVSLLTVEYDVRDDEPERTAVFRLQSASSELVMDWLQHSFPSISQVDGRTIADFSDGNFRVARALAETLHKGETLGRLGSRALFERIFQQRNQSDQNLLAAAEDLSLLYSLDAVDISDAGELARIGSIRGVSALSLYEALAALKGRGVAQVRGRWKAILPHAIANRLAGFALQRIPPSALDSFCTSLTPRMQKSFSRRVGYLHDSTEAQTAVARWLHADGPFGDLVASGDEGLGILTNIAPVEPESVLKKIELEVNGPNGTKLLNIREPTRARWIHLIKTLGYEPEMFRTAAMLLVRFVATDPQNHNQASAREAFAEFFHLYFSGTRAEPSCRRALVRMLANSGDFNQRRCASIALDALLDTDRFSSANSFNFGARSRDWGWQPRFNQDLWDWYSAAIDLAIELSPNLNDARQSLAGSVRDLWRFPACHDSLERAVKEFQKTGPWIEGWIAFRTSLRFEGDEMPAPFRERLESIIELLKPLDLLNRARAVVLGRARGGLDITDGEPNHDDVMSRWHRASEMARDIGRQLAQDDEVRGLFLPELIAEPDATRSFDCGRGLASGASDLGDTWRDLSLHFESSNARHRNATLLGGFMDEAHRRDRTFAHLVLEAAIQNSAIAHLLPYLQARVAVDEEGIARLRRAIAKGVVKGDDFNNLSNFGDSPPEELGLLLLEIADLTDGLPVAIDILHTRLFSDNQANQPLNPSLIEIGRALLKRIDFGNENKLREHHVETIIRACCSGLEGESTARDVCIHIRKAIENSYLSHYTLSHVLKALFDIQLYVALDEFLLPLLAPERRGLRRAFSGFSAPAEKADAAQLCQWADRDPTDRYPLVGHAVSMFTREPGDEDKGILPLFLEILERAPDRRAFLGESHERLQPSGWSGSLAEILMRRRAHILQLGNSPHADVRQWAEDVLVKLDRWIDQERKREREYEGSFE